MSRFLKAKKERQNSSGVARTPAREWGRPQEDSVPRLGGHLPPSASVVDEYRGTTGAQLIEGENIGQEVDDKPSVDAGDDRARDPQSGFDRDRDDTGVDEDHQDADISERLEELDVMDDGAYRSAEGEEEAAAEVSMNPMILQLNREAKSKARQFIKRNFQDPMDLEDASALRMQLQKQAAVAGSQLNGAVQSKLEALKRAADLMDESSLKLGKLSNTMKDVDKRIADSNTAISQYANLCRVHNVRDNVSKVISQIEFFARVPEKVEALKEVIATDPTRIRHSFLECLRLEALREALLQEIKISRVRRRSIATTASRGYSSKLNDRLAEGYNVGLVTKGGKFSPETGSRIKEAVESHLHMVGDLSRLLWQSVWQAIDEMSEVANTAPQDLVAAFEIIEMQQEFSDRQLAQAKARGDDLSDAGGSSSYSAVTEECQARLRSRLQLKVLESFRVVEEHAASMSEGREGKGMSLIQQQLTAASESLSAMTVFKTEVVPCVPPHFQVMDMYIDIFEEIFVPKVRKLCSVDRVASFDPAELLQLVDWFEFYQIQIESFGVDLGANGCGSGSGSGDSHAPRHPSLQEFRHVSDDLMNEYLGRIRSQVMQWFANIKSLPLETRPGEDGTVNTTNPEEMFRCLTLQVAVAEEKLPPEKLKDVVMACLQVLREIQRDTYDALRTSYKDTEPVLMCATINDSMRMGEKSEQYFGEFIDKIPASQESDREMLTAVLEDVEREYVEIANKALSLLAKSLLQCDLQGVFQAMFSPEWEAGELICEAIPVTLADIFPSLEEWLGPLFLGKVVWSLVESISEYYLAALMRNCGDPTDALLSTQAAASASAMKSGIVAAGKQAASAARDMAAQVGVGDEEEEEDGLGNPFGKEGGDDGTPPSGSNNNSANTGIPAVFAVKYRFKNELVAAAQVQNDVEVLSEFFYEYHSLIGRYGKVEDELRPLGDVADIIRAPNFSIAESQIKTLVNKYGHTGTRIVRSVVHANPSLSKQQKSDFTKQVQRLADTRLGADGGTSWGHDGVSAAFGAEEEAGQSKEQSSTWAWFRGRSK